MASHSSTRSDQSGDYLDQFARAPPPPIRLGKMSAIPTTRYDRANMPRQLVLWWYSIQITGTIITGMRDNKVGAIPVAVKVTAIMEHLNSSRGPD